MPCRASAARAEEASVVVGRVARWVWIALMVVGCAEAPLQVDAGPRDAGRPDAGPPAPRPVVTPETYPRVDGSTSTLPLARVIACELLGLDYGWVDGLGSEGEAQIVPVPRTPEEEPLAAWVTNSIVHDRTHQAYLDLIANQADLILVANLPSPEEQALADSNGVTLVAVPIALDALVIIVNAVNPVAGLTQLDVRSIFRGLLTDWSEVGGSPGPIHPYVRPETSGSQQLMNTIVMDGIPMAAWPEDRRRGPMGALIDAIRSDPYSIGYSVFYWVTYQYPRPGLRVLAVDGVAPSAVTIADRSYPYAAEVWLVTRADLASPTAVALRDWLTTSDGQRVVARSGYVPIARSSN